MSPFWCFSFLYFTSLFDDLTTFLPRYSRTLSSGTCQNLHPAASMSSTLSTESETISEKDIFILPHVGVEVADSIVAPSSRITKTLLSRQALFAPSGPMTHSPHCVHGALMRTASTNFSCPVHGSQAHLCSSEARVLSRANKILMYVLLTASLCFLYLSLSGSK